MHKQVFAFRSQVYATIRAYFSALNYVETETPIIVRSPGAESYLQYFATDWENHKREAFPLHLHSSPELCMKQIISEELPRIFQLARCFRNGGEFSDWHNPEFTMLEWYHAHIDFAAFMNLTTNLIDELFSKHSKHKLCEEWTRITVQEAFQNCVGITLQDEDEELAKKAIAKGHKHLNPKDSFHSAFFKLLMDIIEPKLKQMQKVILYDYPVSLAALAKVEENTSGTSIAKRFEIYLHGVEICNAFQECISPDENRARLQHIAQERKNAHLPSVANDMHFLQAIDRGIPACCGNALGLDRLLALLLGNNSLDEVLPFRKNIFSAKHT